MQHTANPQNFRPAPATKTILAALTLALALTMATPAASAQTYSVLYNFTGQSDGGNPEAGVTFDEAGNLYGTTYQGGSTNCSMYHHIGCGTVFKLSHRGAGWTFGLLHEFNGSPDGANPEARVVFGPNGALFGTTSEGGIGLGTVFQLQPPATFCPTPSCPWTETQLYSFDSEYGPANPGGGDLIFDPQGNMWGTTAGGGGYLCDDGSCGGVFELSRSGGGWNEHGFNPFEGISRNPYAGLVTDNAGNFYGTTSAGPGGLYSITSSGSGGTFLLFSQQSSALGGLFLSGSDLIGTTSQGGTSKGGTVFEYSLTGSSLTTLYNFAGPYQSGAGPTATLLMDASGNLYGTTQIDGADLHGSVFKLSQSNGVWTLTTLHDFTGGADGGLPFGQLTMDASGNIYGTTQAGGNSVGNCYQNLGCGVIFEITP
ncbi:MAG: choice-of-anchor tandem repeat GloVer-containing protein [Candidatus Korobacteraceae bacterium]|jgi:uncharacterized repeat protein (TIGR03803 family)